MRFGNQSHYINAWWERVPGEAYWLDITEREDRDRLLAAPRGEGRASHSWTHRIITYVRGGDLVFHYDASQKAIVASSISQGRVERRQLEWPFAAGNPPGFARLPSWCIGLRQSTRLSAPVTLHDIARVQQKLYPTLRALEDQVGDPLYYPFEMGAGEMTQPISGFVLKLPAAFVESFPQLAGAASRAVSCGHQDYGLQRERLVGAHSV